MIKYLSRSFFNLRTFFQCSSCHFLRRQHLSYRFWRIGYSTKTETHNFQIFGFGQANQGVTHPRAFMTSCTYTCLPFNLANGYGRVDAPWKSRSSVGCCFLTGSTPRIYWFEDIGDPFRRIISALFVTPVYMRTDCTCSSNVISAAESGTIWILIGLTVQMCNNAYTWPDPGFNILSSLRLCSQQPGTFGFWEMEELLEESVPLLPLGDVNLFMIFLFWLIGLEIAPSINFWLGLTPFCN